jgi:hypothetical protein
MTDKIEGSPSQHKPFRVRRDAGRSDILASFDTLEDAVRNVRRRRGDWRYVIHDGRKIVWPESRAKVEYTATRHRNRARVGTTSVRVSDFVTGY